MGEPNITYFRNLWQRNMKDLENQCDKWEDTCIDNEIPDDVHGEIRTTIGLARLLMNQKLKQFKGLVDDSESNSGEKEITCSDLQGFWDMVYFEVEKINKCFLSLVECKNNGWKFIEENSSKSLKKKAPLTKASKPAKKIDSSNSHSLAAKQRLAEAKRKMLFQHNKEKEEKFEILQPSKLNSVDNSCSNKVSLIESNKKMKNTDSLKVEIIPDKTDDIVRQKSDQNKENLTTNVISAKIISGVQTKSKMKTEFPVQGKIKKNSKEVMKLQCTTRSMKRAMLADQKK